MIALGVVATTLVVFSLSESAEDVVREDTDFLLSVQEDEGQLKVGGGWCLHAPSHTTGAQLSVAKCSDEAKQDLQDWKYSSQSGLVQLRGQSLCLHADYVSEPEGALLSLQPCDAGSERQAYILDAESQTMRLRHSPELCLHSVNSSVKSGQPVLVLPCAVHRDEKPGGEQPSAHKATQDATAKDTHAAQQFLGHPLTGKEKALESGIMQEVLAEANRKNPSETAPTVTSTPKAAPSVEVQSSIEVSERVGDALATTERAAAAAEQQVHRIVARRMQRDKQIHQKFAKAGDAVADASRDQQLLQNAEEEKKQLHSIVADVEGKYHTIVTKATTAEEAVKKAAHRHSIELQDQAKTKTATVVTQARKDLRQSLKALSSTLTESVDQRQRARAKLVKLRSEHSDEVELAQAALELAKVNKATHLSNTKAREAAKAAHKRAARSISFAQSILATRLKAIKTTERLAVDKAELHSHAAMTEAEENLSRTTQTVLMALDDADASTRLEDIVGSTAVANSDEKLRDVESTDSGSSEFDMEVDGASGDLKDLDDVELLGDHADMISHTPKDTIYTAKMHRCKFPFVYNGEKLYHCKESSHGSWCATDIDDSNSVKKWDYCVLNQHAVALAKQAAMEAAQLEIKRVLAATGAEITPGALRESLRAAAVASQAAPATSTEAKKHSDQGDIEQPAMGRVQAASNIDKIINTASKT